MIAAGVVVAGPLGLTVPGAGTGSANAAPSNVGRQTTWAQDPGWGPYVPGGPHGSGGYWDGGSA